MILPHNILLHLFHKQLAHEGRLSWPHLAPLLQILNGSQRDIELGRDRPLPTKNHLPLALQVFLVGVFELATGFLRIADVGRTRLADDELLAVVVEDEGGRDGLVGGAGDAAEVGTEWVFAAANRAVFAITHGPVGAQLLASSHFEFFVVYIGNLIVLFVTKWRIADFLLSLVMMIRTSVVSFLMIHGGFGTF